MSLPRLPHRALNTTTPKAKGASVFWLVAYFVAVPNFNLHVESSAAPRRDFPLCFPPLLGDWGTEKCVICSISREAIAVFACRKGAQQVSNKKSLVSFAVDSVCACRAAPCLAV